MVNIRFLKNICQLLVAFTKINEAAYQLSLLNRNITISQKKISTFSIALFIIEIECDGVFYLGF